MAGLMQENRIEVRKNVKPEEFYNLKEELGKGKFGVVYRCEEKSTGKTWAAKYVKTIRAKDREEVQREIDLMGELDHPSLMALIDAFQTTRLTVMILECITGGELFERIVDDEFDLTESEVISYMRQICAGVQHMHHHRIIHLDLKPENIMCVNRTGFQLKIIDFGLARKHKEGADMKVLCGTPEFVAPEVINFDAIGPYTDMWSVGVICYVLLSGLSPFMGDNDAETLNNVTSGEWDFDDEVFDGLSCEAKDFITCLLVKQTSKRMTVDECFRHPWLSEISTRTKACETKLSTARLKKFLARRRWQRTANAVRAIGRMNALRLVSQKRASKSGGSTSSDKSSPTSPNSPKSPPPKSRERDPSPQPKQEKRTAESLAHSEKPTPHADSEKEKAEIDTGIDSRTNSTNTESSTREAPASTQRVRHNHLLGSDREVASPLDSDVENDSGLDLSLDHHALGKQSTRSSQDSTDDGRHELLVDAAIKTNGVDGDEEATREALLSGVVINKDAQILIDTNSVTSSQTDKSDISVCSDVSEDTSGSDQGVNMDRYLFDPSKGVKNQAAKWEVRTSSPDRRASKSKGGQQQQAPPQQAPVFRQKFRHCEVAVGSEAKFECRVDGHPPPDIIWYKNGKRMQEGDRYSITRVAEDVHSLVVRQVSRDDQGTYMCEARSPAGKARCSARLVVQQQQQQHQSSSNDQTKRSTSETKESSAKQSNTGRKFWQFGSANKNKDQREQKDKSATQVKAAAVSSPPPTKQSLFSLSLDRKGSHRGGQASSTPTVSAPVQASPSPRSAVDKLKERAEAFTQQYEKRREDRRSLADREPRRSNISEYLNRYTRSASADRSSSFSLGSSPGRRKSVASVKDDDDLEPRGRPRLATYATMIRSTQSIGALTAKFEQNKSNGTNGKASAGTPKKDLKYNANLDAKKALFSSSSNGTTSASPARNRAKEPVSIASRSSVVSPPSTSSLRSKFESPGDKDRGNASFSRSSQQRLSTSRLSYLDKAEARDKELSPPSSFSRTAARHSTIGVTKLSSADSNSKYDGGYSGNGTRREQTRPVSSFTPSSSSSSSNQPTFISRYETVINSDSESSIASSSSISDRKPRVSPSSSISDKTSRSSVSISSRYEIRSPPSEKSPSFVKKPQKLTTSEGESATFSCVVDGEPKPLVTWHFRGKPLVDEGRIEIYEEKGSHFLEIFDLQTKDAGLYTCRIVNSAGRSSSLVELVVNSKPKRPPFFLQKLSDCEVHESGANGRLQCKLDGEPAPEVSWMREGKPLQESERVHFVRNANGIHALIIDDVTEDDDAIYTCTAKNKHGQVASTAELIVEIEPPTKSESGSFVNELTLHIDEDDIQPSTAESSFTAPAAPKPAAVPSSSAPQFLRRPTSVAADETKSARFTCSVSGVPPPKVTWAHDDHVLRDEGRFEIYDEGGEFILEIFDLLPSDDGMYTVTAENSAGKVATGAQLTVHSKTPEKPSNTANFTANSLSDVRTDEVYSSEDVPSIRSEQIPPPVTAKSTEFEPPSRIPPEFLAHPTPQTLVEPNSAKFSCRVVGDPKPSVTWSRNGVVLSDSGRFEIYEEKDTFVLEIFDTTPQDTGTYVCTATNLAGQKMAEAVLTVESSAPKGTAPEFLEKMSNATVKDGDSAKFVCKLTGVPSPAVQWFYRDQEIIGSDEVYELYHEGETASLCLPEVLPEDEGEYSCTIKNTIGETTCKATLKVNIDSDVANNATVTDSVAEVTPKVTKPEFTLKLKDVQAIDGNPLSLPVKIKGSPELDVKWFFNNDLIKEDDDFKFVQDGDRYSLVIAEVYPDDGGTYTCKVSNSAGVIECSAKVFVQESDVDGGPPKFLQKPRSINIDEGSSVTLSCKIDGEPLPSVTWIKDGRPIEAGRRFKMESSGISGTTRSLNIPTVLATDAGNYTCSLQNEHGVEQCSVSVVVKPLEEEQTDFRSLLKSRPRLQNISNSPNNVSSDKSEAEQVDFRHVLTRHVTTRKRPFFMRPLHDLEVREGESVTFECHVDGCPPPSIVWKMNKKEIKESKYFQMSYKDNVAKLVIAEAFPEDEGDYTCVATNGSGQVTCKAELTVQDEDESVSQKPTIEDPILRGTSMMNDPTRCVIESDSTHDKVANTFNVRLSKVFNGTAPPTEEIQHNTNTNNNNNVCLMESLSIETSVSSELLSAPQKQIDSAPSPPKSISADGNTMVDSRAKSPALNGENTESDVEPEAPSFLESLKDTTVLEENSAMLKCKFVGEPEPDIHWYKDGVELESDRKYKLDFPDDDVAVLIVKETTLEDAGEYTCKAVNASGTKETHAEIIVEAPARIKDAPRTMQVTAGGDLVMSCSFVAVPEPDVVIWSKNRKTVQEDARVRISDTDTTTTLTVGKATHADGGRYTLLVENDLGSDEAQITVSVLDKPDPPCGKPIASTVSRDSLTLSWMGSSYDGGSRITGYVIEMRTSDDHEDSWTEADFVSNTSHTMENLTPETKYHFRISSKNEFGTSDPGQVSDPILTVVETKPKKTKADSPKTEPENDGEECEFRHVTIKPEKEFSETYQIKEVLGKGRFGTVHRCVDKASGKAYAGKMIKTIKQADKDSVRNEIDIMNKLHHPKLLQCLDAFESPKQMIMVLEIVNGGELFERVIDDDFGLTESSVIEFMTQICAGVSHMHRQNILHLDLKPENILCVDKTGSRIKLIDFGLARAFNPKESTKVMFGTPEFVAPEVINYDAIGYTTDMWSVGVICYILLSGLSPFMGDNDAETLSNVTLAEWDFEDEAFDEISEDAKDFIEGLLIQGKHERMTADQCLEDKWLVTESNKSKTNKISTAKLKNFVARRRWQSDSEESDTSASEKEPKDDEKTATAVRAIGRMASLSLFGGQKKTTEVGGITRSQSSTLPSTKAKTPDKMMSTTERAESAEAAFTFSENSASSSARNGDAKKDTPSAKEEISSQNKVPSELNNVDVKDEESEKTASDDDDEMEDDVDDVDGPGKDLNQNIPGAPHFLKEIKDCEVFEGDSARFDCKVAGDPEPDIKWLQDGVEIEESARFIFDYDDDGSCSLIIRRIEEDDEGDYCVKATNAKGEASCIAELFVEGF